MSRRSCFPKVLSAACALWMISCAAGRESGLTEVVLEPPVVNTTESLLLEADTAWKEREDPDRLLEAIMLYKRIVREDPTQRKILVRLSRALYFYADGYLSNDEERLIKYDQATYYGEKALALNPSFKAQIDAGKPIIDALEVLGPEDCEAVYWTAASLGKWAKLKGIAAILRNTDLFKAMMEKADYLDESYNYGGPSRTWGAYYAAAPPIAGGDLTKSLAYFEKARRLAPDFFATRVLMAELYASRAHDKKLFEELLVSVIEGDPTTLPDVIPEQKVEQAKARLILANIASYFPEASSTR